MVLDKLKRMISIQLGSDENTLTSETDIVHDLGADSLDVAELLMGIEDEFGVLLTEEMVADVHTIGELVALIENR